jgi:serine/threonine protein kinase
MVDPQSWRFEPTAIAPRAGGVAGRVGQYDLIEQIGRGGMGVVWKATHRHLHQIVAIKFLAPEAWSDPQAIARFYREMRAIGRVTHPNLIRALDAGDYDGHHVLVMEYVEGLTLRDILQRNGRMTVGAACELIRHAANGLAAIDAAGMVHRDLKPSNLFLTSDGVLKILDLGLARISRERDERDFTSTDQLLGTIDYMAPEQSIDPRSVDVRADLYSLGCTLYALLTGAPPFIGPAYLTLESRLRAHRVDLPPLLREVRRDVPTPVADLVGQLLRKLPEERVQTPAELASALAPFAAAEDVLPLLSTRLSAASTIDRPSERSSLPIASSPVETSKVTVPTPESPSRPLSTQPMSRVRPRTRGVIVAVVLLLAAVVVGPSFLVPQDPKSPAVPKEQDPINSTPALAVQKVPKKANIAEELKAVPNFSEAPLLKWQDLLDRKPVPVFWKDDAGLATFMWREGERQVFASHDKIGVLSLGTIESADFELQTELHQTGWPGGAGLFVAMQNRNPEKPTDWRGCVWTVERLESAAGPSTYQLAVSHIESIPAVDRAFDFRMRSFATETIEAPVGQPLLHLTFRANRLTAIRFDGKPLRDLVDLVNQNAPPPNWSGGFGVFVNGATATYRNAQVRRLDSER